MVQPILVETSKRVFTSDFQTKVWSQRDFFILEHQIQPVPRTCTTLLWKHLRDMELTKVCVIYGVLVYFCCLPFLSYKIWTIYQIILLLNVKKKWKHYKPIIIQLNLLNETIKILQQPSFSFVAFRALLREWCSTLVEVLGKTSRLHSSDHCYRCIAVSTWHLETSPYLFIFIAKFKKAIINTNIDVLYEEIFPCQHWAKLINTKLRPKSFTFIHCRWCLNSLILKEDFWKLLI